jgi:hypothetical protein
MEVTAFRVALLRDFTRNVMGAWRLALARGHDAHYSSSDEGACRNRLGRLKGGHVAGEATREAPAQAELRPTCAGASSKLQGPFRATTAIRAAGR